MSYGDFDWQEVIIADLLQLEACWSAEDKAVAALVDTFVTFVQEMVDVEWNKGFFVVFFHMCFPSNLVAKVATGYSTIAKCSNEYKH